MMLHNPDAETFAIALVDDDPAFVRTLEAALARHFSLRKRAWTFAAYPDAATFRAAFDSARPDIVFIDILMPGENGIDLARWVYDRDKRPVIVYITASPDFAAHGYGVNALAYIQKPVSEDDLARVMQACRRRLDSQSRRLVLRNRDGYHSLAMDGITHLESNSRRVIFHAGKHTVDCSGKLDDFLARLPATFLQVHKSFAVNLDRVTTMRPQEITLDTGVAVPVSRRFRTVVADRFFARLRGEGETEGEDA